jgi:hypothetical protein
MARKRLIGVLTAALLLIPMLSSAQRAALPVWNVTASPYSATGNGSTDDTPAFTAIISACPAAGCRIYIPDGTYKITSTLNIPAGAAVSFIGESKENTALVATGFAVGQPIISYNGTSSRTTQGIEMRNLTLSGSNNNPNGLALTWVSKSIVDNVQFSTLDGGVVCSSSFSNTFSNNNSFSLLGDTYNLSTDSNNNTILGGAFGSAQNGVHVAGSLNGLSIIGSDCEDMSTNGYCVYLTPPTGSSVQGVSVLNTHFEQVRGAALYANGADANSVVNLSFDSNFVAGGYHDAFGQASGLATNAVILKNVTGFEANNNVFYDWQNDAFALNGTEGNGVVEHNMLLQPSGNSQMVLASPIFRPSVRTTNNTSTLGTGTQAPVGRQELFRSTVPNVGSCNVGDIAWNTAPEISGYAGWICVTAGSPGDWEPFGLIQ